MTTGRTLTLRLVSVAGAIPWLARADGPNTTLHQTDADELILEQTLEVRAPVEAAHYAPEAKIGDPGTNTLHIVNYVPAKVLTLRAEVSDRWPEVMKQDAGNLMNVIVFDDLGDAGTRVRSYGVGYRDLPAYDELMEFFIPANEGLLRKLKGLLEGDAGDANSAGSQEE